jgi:hypothetical protein
MKRIRAFINGVREFRWDFTTHYDSEQELNAYDWGRELAHMITLRHWD